MGQYQGYDMPNNGLHASARRPLPFGPDDYRREIERVQKARRRKIVFLVIILLLIVVAVVAVNLLGVSLPPLPSLPW